MEGIDFEFILATATLSAGVRVANAVLERGGDAHEATLHTRNLARTGYDNPATVLGGVRAAPEAAAAAAAAAAVPAVRAPPATRPAHAEPALRVERAPERAAAVSAVDRVPVPRAEPAQLVTRALEPRPRSAPPAAAAAATTVAARGRLPVPPHEQAPAPPAAPSRLRAPRAPAAAAQASAASVALWGAHDETPAAAEDIEGECTPASDTAQLPSPTSHCPRVARSTPPQRAQTCQWAASTSRPGAPQRGRGSRRPPPLRRRPPPRRGRQRQPQPRRQPCRRAPWSGQRPLRRRTPSRLLRRRTPSRIRLRRRPHCRRRRHRPQRRHRQRHWPTRTR